MLLLSCASGSMALRPETESIDTSVIRIQAGHLAALYLLAGLA